jgi:hypothetical protein
MPKIALFIISLANSVVMIAFNMRNYGGWCDPAHLLLDASILERRHMNLSSRVLATLVFRMQLTRVSVYNFGTYAQFAETDWQPAFFAIDGVVAVLVQVSAEPGLSQSRDAADGNFLA